MKKKYVLIIIALIILVIAGFLIYNIVIENGKKYEIEAVKQYNYFVLSENDLYGVIDRQGNIIIEPKYEDVKIPNPEKSIFVCYQNGNTNILNEKNEEILAQYEGVEPIRLKNISGDLLYEKSVLKFKRDEKFGLINFKGEEICKPEYEKIESLPYKEGELLVQKDGKTGVINIKGNVLVNIVYEQVNVDEYYTEENSYKKAGYIVCQKTEEGYRYGYLNNKGKQILEVEYNEISRVTEIHNDDEIVLVCSKNGQYGVNKGKKVIIENQYQSIRYDNENKVFVVEKSKKYGIANEEGKLIVPVEYSQIDINGIYLYAQNEQGITVYNSNGTQANIDSNIAILNTDNEKYKIRINNQNGTKYGVINKDGKELIDEKYNYIEYLYENYFIVSDNGKLGIVDDKENVKVEIKYDSLQKVQGTDLIQTTLVQDNQTEIYSNTFEKICEMNDAKIENDKNFIKVYNENGVKYFDSEGKELKNTEIYESNKLFVQKKENLYGYTDKLGNLVIDYKYDRACEFNEYGFAAINKEGKWGVINEKGEEIVAPTYEIKGEEEPSFIGKYYKVIYGFGEIYYTNR